MIETKRSSPASKAGLLRFSLQNLSKLKYGPSPVAYFAIPMVGGMFIDFFNAVLISANISWWA